MQVAAKRDAVRGVVREGPGDLAELASARDHSVGIVFPRALKKTQRFEVIIDGMPVRQSHMFRPKTTPVGKLLVQAKKTALNEEYSEHEAKFGYDIDAAVKGGLAALLVAEGGGHAQERGRAKAQAARKAKSETAEGQMAANETLAMRLAGERVRVRFDEKNENGKKRRVDYFGVILNWETSKRDEGPHDDADEPNFDGPQARVMIKVQYDGEEIPYWSPCRGDIVRKETEKKKSKKK